MHLSGGPDDRVDEVYAGVAKREVHEELGVAPALTFVGAFGPEPGVHYEQIHLFHGISDGPFLLQPDEVEAHRMLAPADGPAFLTGGEPITDSLQWWLAWLGRR